MSYFGHKSASHYDGSTKESWHPYTCGHCGTKVSGAVISSLYDATQGKPTLPKWLLCPNCGNGSVLALDGKVYPAISFGPNIDGLPKEVLEAYTEARACMSVNAFVACELICRNILMYVAVEKGAKKGDKFENYINYLAEQGYVTPPMKKWVDLIRQHGNKSAHELETPDKSRAESTMMFTAELLRLIYEMEHLSNKYTQNP